MADFEVTLLTDDSFGGGTLADETADGGGLSLREAIGLADATAGADTITFAEGLLDQSLSLTSQLTITSDVTINGDIDGDGDADVTIDANRYGRVMAVTDGTVALHALTLTDGNGVNGAGLLVDGAAADVTLTNSTVRNNDAGANFPFGNFVGGGIAVLNGALVVESSTIRENTVYGDTATGGGIYVGANGTLDVTNSTVANNKATPYIGIPNVATLAEGGGIAVRGGIVTLTHTTVAYNEAQVGQSVAQIPVPGRGGGIAVDNAATLTLTNSLVVGNTAGNGANVAGTVALHPAQ